MIPIKDNIQKWLMFNWIVLNIKTCNHFSECKQMSNWVISVTKQYLKPFDFLWK